MAKSSEITVLGPGEADEHAALVKHGRRAYVFHTTDGIAPILRSILIALVLGQKDEDYRKLEAEYQINLSKWVEGEIKAKNILIKRMSATVRPQTIRTMTARLLFDHVFHLSEIDMDLPNNKNITNPPPSQNSSASDMVMLPTNLWNLQYITHTPETLASAIELNSELISNLFVSSAPNQTPPSTSSSPIIPNLHQNFRISTPLITPYDGKPENLRPFCS
ncbi:hypothetical protein EPUL_004659 [Erysiphe pulchra]|uniref:Uncharacterized protein n=1 Tax=Erysiphe pulchra TaxID=225359 RepID=A0A2S4PSE0_9PEZI|nr:hypothetical protein EPUL_004659 [Erysiphe pulchra]